MEKKKFKLGLLPKLLIAIVLGIIIGQFFPVWFCRVVVTASSIFSSFLKFVIPLMIVAYVTMGIADLKSGAGKLLLITVALAYGSTLIAGSASYLVSANLFPSFMSEGALEQIAATADNSLASYISISIPPILDTLSAVVLAFVLGLCMSTLRGKTIGDTLYNCMKDFSAVIDQVLHSVIIPLLPLYVCGTFIDMTKSGKTFAILGILWKVFLVVIIMHLICIFIQFCVAGAVSHKNPLQLIKNQIPGYTTALGTQSSAATIPVNLQCAAADGVSAQIRNFVVPLCANIHMADHHYRACYRCLPDESAAHQPGYRGTVHHDSGRCHGGFSRCSRRLHHDGSAFPVHDLRCRGRRPQRPHLRHYGGTVHHAGFFRHCLQCLRRQRHRRDRGDHLPEIHSQERRKRLKMVFPQSRLTQ